MSRFALLALVPLGLSTACGGSSSETPFPLEPDLSRLDGGPTARSRYVVYSGETRTPEAEEPGEPEGETKPEPKKP